jgi:Flp pilus assembly protein TadG
MAMVNGPIGRDSERSKSGILNGEMRCHFLQALPQTLGWHVPRPSRRPAGRWKKGQAIVETALLFPILMFLTMGTADLGRVFYYSIAVTNAAREAARQGTYWDPTTNTNTFDDYADILAAAQTEAGANVTLSLPTIAPSHCLTGQPSSWTANYPSQPNTGYVYICFDGQDTPAPAAATNTIEVTILYNFQPVTPFSQMVGAGTVDVLASTTMQVQQP